MNTTAQTNIFGLVLAAGSASRFGSTKLLEKLDGIALVRRAVLSCNEVFGARTLLVLGHDWQQVLRTSELTSGYVVFNSDYRAGIGTSIAAGVRSLRQVADAIVVVMADQPLISPAHLRNLAARWSGSADEIVATAFATTSGPPVLFPHGCFDDLAQLDGDTGARQLLQDSRFRVRSVAFEDAAIDIDTPADLTRAANSARN